MNNDYAPLLSRSARAGPHTSQPVSVVIPTYNRAEMLDKTLAALTHQTYPQALAEIVVVDDGSDDDVLGVVRRYDERLDIVLVRQPDRGFRVAAATNRGIRAARHHRVVLLDADMIPAPALLREHMQVLSALDNVVVIGHRVFTDATGITADEIAADPNFCERLPLVVTRNEMWTGRSSAEDWRVQLYRATNLLKRDMWPFRAVAAGNLGFSRSLASAAGHFCEEYQEWGCQDGDFGYQAYNAGAYFIPVVSAVAYHQEPIEGASARRRLSFARTCALRAERCPTPPYRNYLLGRRYRVPRVSICIQGADETLLATYCQRLAGISDRLDCEIVAIWVHEQVVFPDAALWKTLTSRAGPVLCSSSRHGARLNCGVRAASGSYLLHLDAGSAVPDLETIARLARWLDQRNVGCVVAALPGGAFRAPIAEPLWMYRRRDWSRLGGFDETADANESCLAQLRTVCLVDALDGRGL